MSGSARPHPFTSTAVALLILAVGCSADAATTDGTRVTPSAASPAPPAIDATDPSPTPAYQDTDTPVDGIYTSTVSEADAHAAGVPRGAYTDIVGDYELDLDHGDARVMFTHGVTVQVLGGTYEVDGDILTVTDEGLRITLRWERDGRDLRLTVLRATEGPSGLALDRTVFGSHAWERIG